MGPTLISLRDREKVLEKELERLIGPDWQVRYHNYITVS